MISSHTLEWHISEIRTISTGTDIGECDSFTVGKKVDYSRLFEKKIEIELLCDLAITLLGICPKGKITQSTISL